MTRPRHVYDTSRIATIPDTRRIHVRDADGDDDGDDDDDYDNDDDLENPVITQEETNTRARFRQGLSRRLFFLSYYLNVSTNTIVFLAWYSAWFFALAHQKTKGTQEVYRNFLNDLPSVPGSTVFCFLLSSFPLELLSISRSLRGTTTLCHVESTPVVHRLGVFPVAMDVSRASSIIQTDEDDCDDRSADYDDDRVFSEMTLQLF